MFKILKRSLSQAAAPKQYLEMAKYTCTWDKMSLYFILYCSSIQGSLNCYGANHAFKLGCKNFNNESIGSTIPSQIYQTTVHGV